MSGSSVISIHIYAGADVSIYPPGITSLVVIYLSANGKSLEVPSVLNINSCIKIPVESNNLAVQSYGLAIAICSPVATAAVNGNNLPSPISNGNYAVAFPPSLSAPDIAEIGPDALIIVKSSGLYSTKLPISAFILTGLPGLTVNVPLEPSRLY
jgi:hypothetical protein